MPARTERFYPRETSEVILGRSTEPLQMTAAQKKKHLRRRRSKERKKIAWLENHKQQYASLIQEQQRVFNLAHDSQKQQKANEHTDSQKAA